MILVPSNIALPLWLRSTETNLRLVLSSAKEKRDRAISAPIEVIPVGVVVAMVIVFGFEKWFTSKSE